MIRICLLLLLALPGQLSQFTPGEASAEDRPPASSAYFAFADHDYIFTIEVVKPGIPLLNFVSMAEQDIVLSAKNVRLTLENRKATARLFAVEAGDFQQPMVVPSLTMHPRSSFGIRMEGDFDKVTELRGAAIRLGDEDFKLAPMTSFAFEGLVLKVNRINLGSPDFGEDWHVLRLERLGSRSPARGNSF
jgi:hypothetical protein